MRRRTSFISPSRAPVRMMTALVWALALGLTVTAVLGIVETRALRADARTLSARINELAATEAATGDPAASAPEAGQIARLAADIDRFNAMIGPRPAPLAHLLEGLEASLPADVWINQMVWSADRRTLAVSLQSDDETSLPRALSEIEAAPFLHAVILERQVRLQLGRRTILQYDIEAGLN